MLSLLLAAATATTPAPDRGAIGDPAAFLEACSMAYEGIPTDIQKRLDSATNDEKQEFLGVYHMTKAMCNGVLVSVAQTVMLGAPYSVGGNKRVCVDPNMTDLQLYQRAKKFVADHPDALATLAKEQSGTPEFLVVVLAENSTC